MFGRSQALRSFVGRRAALLSVLALFLQAWLPIVAQQAGHLGLDATGAVICLAGEHDHGTTGQQIPDQSADQSPCALCQVIHAASLFAPPPTIALVTGTATFHPYSVALASTNPPSRIVEPSARPRAPPHVA